ncbi:barstar family protein [Streptomyces sp. NPDC050803]|uniref:barstar family protein n=1 Tax=unclassified Streptomyces TaxID=2593676 RepID=UPI00342005A5
MHISLTQRRSPWVVCTRRDDAWLRTESAELTRRGGRVVRLDGRRMRNPDAVFDAFAQQLAFPGYFGRNWDALVDCLRDWHGHGGDSKDLAVFIDHADGLRHTEFLGLLVSVLCQAAWHANLQLDADGVPHQDARPFALHFVLLVHTVSPAAFADAVAGGQDVSATLDGERLTATLTADDWPETAAAAHQGTINTSP